MTIFCQKPHLPVGGRLSQFLDFWEANTWALEVVKFGYAIEFYNKPPPFQQVCWITVASKEAEQVLTIEILSLLLNAISIVPQTEWQEGFYSALFLVPRKGGTLRPIINLKPLNTHVRVTKFKMENLRSVIRFVQLGDWLVLIDFKRRVLMRTSPSFT